MEEERESLINASALTAEFQRFYQEGQELERDIQQYFDGLTPSAGSALSSSPIAQQMEALSDRAHAWFNQITVHVLPQTAFDRAYTRLLLRRLSAALNVMIFHEEYHHREHSLSGDTSTMLLHNVQRVTDVDGARSEATRVIAQALRLIRTATTNPLPLEPAPRSAGHVPNTAFILMWMDKSRPELVDVHQAVKEVFAEFGIKAQRADEIQHQDKITDLILRRISESELLLRI